MNGSSTEHKRFVQPCSSINEPVDCAARCRFRSLIGERSASEHINSFHHDRCLSTRPRGPPTNQSGISPNISEVAVFPITNEERKSTTERVRPGSYAEWDEFDNVDNKGPARLRQSDSESLGRT